MVPPRIRWTTSDTDVRFRSNVFSYAGNLTTSVPLAQLELVLDRSFTFRRWISPDGSLADEMFLREEPQHAVFRTELHRLLDKPTTVSVVHHLFSFVPVIPELLLRIAEIVTLEATNAFLQSNISLVMAVQVEMHEKLVPLPKHGLESGLEMFVWCDGEGRDGECCVVCLEEFTWKTTVVGRMPCGHVFHLNCITKWLGVNLSCPVCRLQVLNHQCLGR